MSWDVTDGKNKKTCHTAWEIYNAILQMTGREMCAKDTWVKAGKLSIGEEYKTSLFKVTRIS